jgi:NADH:ubiquinone oxidoreductase subunit 6 (subunit J)
VMVQPWSLRGVPADQPTTVQIGQLLMGPNSYALPFEIASLLLTAAMIGAIVIARED